MVLDYLYWAHCCGIELFMLSSLLGYCVIHAVLVAVVSGYLSCAYPCDIWLYWLNQLLLLEGYSIVWSSIREENRPFSALQIRFTLFSLGWLSVKPPGSVTPPENLDVESLGGCTSSEDMLVLLRLPSLVPAPSLNWHFYSSVMESSCKSPLRNYWIYYVMSSIFAIHLLSAPNLFLLIWMALLSSAVGFLIW